MSAMNDEAVAFHRQNAADFHNSGAARAFHIERLLALGAAPPDEQIARAHILAGRGQWEQAADALRAVTAEPFNDLELIQDFADLMPIMDDPARAEAQFSKLLEHQSETDRILVRGNWWTAGPFSGESDVELSQPPDLDARKSASAVSNGPDLHWRMAESRAPKMDLSAIYADAKHISVYAQTRIYSGKDRDMLLTAQTADEVWFNSKRIYKRSTMGSTELVASLHRGWNSVVERVEITEPNTLTFGLTEDPVAISHYFRDYP